MAQASAPPPGTVEILAVIVAGGLAWAGQSFREFRALEDRVQAQVNKGQELLARRSGRHLATVMRGGLVPIVDAYFAQRPPEVPTPLDANDLRETAMRMNGDPGLAPLVFRTDVTVPAVRRVVDGVLSSLSDLSESVALTPEMVDAAFELGAHSGLFEDSIRQARYLAFRYLGQLCLLIGWAFAVLGALAIGLDPAVPVLAGAVAAVHGVALEVARRRLERGLQLSQTMGEAAQT